MNKVIIIGNVGRDAETRDFNGTMVANFSIATTEKWKNKQGEKQEETEWHNIVIWGKLAEIADKYVKKGIKVAIEGKIKTKEWVDKENIKRYNTEIIASNMELLTFADSGNNGAGQPTPPAQSQPADDMDDGSDLPF